MKFIKNRMLSSLLFVCSLLLSYTSFADLSFQPIPPSLDAKAYVLVDYHTGQILVNHNADTPIDPASLTKMITIYVVDNELAKGNLHLDDLVTISENAWRTEGSRMFVEVGSKISVRDLIQGVVIQSGNDASLALAEHVAGSEEGFVALMNHYAQAIGMKNTHFVNTTGLPHENHTTTVNDLSILATRIISDFPETYKWYSEKWYTYKDIKQPNRNRLLWLDPDVDGIKTGHSSTAGFCLAASSKKNDMRLIAILAGADSDNARTTQTQQLLNFGFRFYETHHLFDGLKSIKSRRVWMSNNQKLELGLSQDLYITIPRGQYDKLDANVVIQKQLVAPIAKGKSYGKLTVKLGDTLITENTLVALSSVEKGSLFSRFSDYISLALQKVFKSEES